MIVVLSSPGAAGVLYAADVGDGALNDGSVERAALWGRDHPHLGEIAVASVSPTLAIAMSAGAVRKARPPLDPNEDAAAAASGRHVDLIAVADAHLGCEAAELAVAAVLDCLDDETFGLGDGLVDVIFRAGMAVQRGTSHPSCPHPQSRTTIAFAVIGDGAFHWISMGDSSVALVSTTGVERLDVPRTTFLGYRFTVDELDTLVTRGTRTWMPGDVLVLATDGLESVGSIERRPADAVASVVLNPSDALARARGLVQAALASRASDAVTVAVAVSP